MNNSENKTARRELTPEELEMVHAGNWPGRLWNKIKGFSDGSCSSELVGDECGRKQAE